MTGRDDPHLLSGAYALNALDKKEREHFEALLLESEELRTEVDGMSDTAVLLGLSARPVAPSEGLKASIMSMLDATPQLAALTSAETSAPTSAETSTTAAPTSEQNAVIRSIAGGTRSRSEHRARAKWFARPLGIAAAAAAAVALFVSGSVLGQSFTNDDFEQQQASSLAELTAAADLETTEGAVEGGGAARLIWSSELQRSAVLVDGLPSLDGGKTYQLWYIDSDGARSAGTFDAAEGTSWRVLDGEFQTTDVVGMTVEPSGGSDAPTTDPILVIDEA
jgi:anti-sigma-K factor RskA